MTYTGPDSAPFGTIMQANQFSLLAKRRFLPLFITQFLNAFNDNLFKQALLVMIAGLMKPAIERPEVLVTIVGAKSGQWQVLTCMSQSLLKLLTARHSNDNYDIWGARRFLKSGYPGTLMVAWC
jgi:hypothetical protein